MTSTEMTHTRRLVASSCVVLAGLLASGPARAVPPPLVEPALQVRGVAELGTFGAAAHTVQFGKDSTRFDYVAEGGQNVLFLFARLSVELELNGRHTVVLLYQPLDVRSSVLLDRDVTIDEQRFARDTALDLRYGFDFYRASYVYDLLGKHPAHELSLGGSLQLRNATIDFSAADGSARRTKRDLGPVPLLKARGRYTFDSGWWVGAEVDGFYAPVKYINGGSSDVEGAIIDLSLRGGVMVTRTSEVFVNLRYLGGGASGTSKGDDDRGDGYVSNWLHFLALSVGVQWNPTARW